MCLRSLTMCLDSPGESGRYHHQHSTVLLWLEHVHHFTPGVICLPRGEEFFCDIPVAVLFHTLTKRPGRRTVLFFS